MVMSQGTYTFLTCFAGFWLVWAVIVMLCCFCSFVRRKLKRRRRGGGMTQQPEQGLRALEMEPMDNCGGPSAEPYRLCPAPVQSTHTIPQGSWTASRDTDVFGKPPCYEDAVLMEDPPPPYSEVLADTRAGTYTKPEARVSREPKDTEMSKSLSESTYPSLIHLPMAEHWDSLGRLFSTMDLNRNNLPLPASHSSTVVTPVGPREGGTMAGPGPGRPLLDPTCDLPTAFLVFGRSTAV